ncbi:MAG: helix-turn-helix domain-containing protein [Candidatus Binatia bacterium]
MARMLPPTPALPSSAVLAASLKRYAAELPADELPGFVGELEAAKALAWSRLVAPAPPTLQTEPLLTAEELAPVIKLPVHAVRDRARRGIIPSVQVGRYVRFQASAVIAALKGDGVPRSTHPVAEKNPRKLRALQTQCP